MKNFLLLGTLIVLLIVGVLVIKNMGGDTADGKTQTKAKMAVERAHNTADKVNVKVEDIGNKLKNVE